MSTIPIDPAPAGPVAPAARKKGHKKKWLAAAALLLAGFGLIGVASHGGTTWAMWQSDVTQQGKAFQSGDLGLALSGPPGSFDTSPDKTPTAIDLSTFRIVPGDRISIAQAQAITMIGTNLKADWKVQLPAGGALTGPRSSGVRCHRQDLPRSGHLRPGHIRPCPCTGVRSAG